MVTIKRGPVRRPASKVTLAGVVPVLVMTMLLVSTTVRHDAAQFSMPSLLICQAMSLMQADQERSSMLYRQQQMERNPDFYRNSRGYYGEIPGLPRYNRYNRYNYNTNNSNRFRRRDPSLGWLPTIADWVQPKVERLARESYVPPYRYNAARARSSGTGTVADYNGNVNNSWRTTASSPVSAASRRRLGWLRSDEQERPQGIGVVGQQEVEPFQRRSAAAVNDYNGNYYNDNARSYYEDDNYFADRNYYQDDALYNDNSGRRFYNSDLDPGRASNYNSFNNADAGRPASTVVRRFSTTLPPKTSYTSDFAEGGTLRQGRGSRGRERTLSGRMGTYSSSIGDDYLPDEGTRTRARSLADTTEIPSDGSVVTFPMLDPSVASVKVTLEAPADILTTAVTPAPVEAVVEIWQEQLNGASQLVDEVYVQDNDEVLPGICETVIDLPIPSGYDSTFSIAICNIGPREYPIYARVTPYSGRNIDAARSTGYGLDNLNTQNRRLNNRSRNRYYRGSGRRLYDRVDDATTRPRTGRADDIRRGGPRGFNDYDPYYEEGGGYGYGVNDRYYGGEGSYNNRPTNNMGPRRLGPATTTTARDLPFPEQPPRVEYDRIAPRPGQQPPLAPPERGLGGPGPYY